MPRRCPVERTFAWLNAHRRLARDHERDQGVSAPVRAPVAPPERVIPDGRGCTGLARGPPAPRRPDVSPHGEVTHLERASVSPRKRLNIRTHAPRLDQIDEAWSDGVHPGSVV
jgi:hypothetical protein